MITWKRLLQGFAPGRRKQPGSLHVESIPQLLSVQAARIPNAPAILGLGRAPLTYASLHQHVTQMVEELREMGISRGERVALVMPNGPDMAVAFLVVASVATCAPLNSAYSASEFEFYLADLHAKTLIIQAGMDTPAVAAARMCGAKIIELFPNLSAEAGIFSLCCVRETPAYPGELAQPDDVALVLHTSGTTARPKIVPLTQRNLCASARNVCAALQLAPTDRCLNVMPFFHVHGLIGALLPSLSAGGSVACTPGAYAPKFFAWMNEFCPTWYTSVPSIHQSFLARAAANQSIIERCPLRFIRSGSSPLPPQLMARMESTYHAPVIEAYGMTETTNQISCNPLPPGMRKIGSVGKPTGTRVAIMDDAGHLLPPGTTGEVVVRGMTIMSGYENNPAATAKSFTRGWFRTGDLGHLDADGYLFITGRLKEIINRGGEKVSPREVDEVLLDHAAIAQAVTFAVPHATLGEEVAAAIVLNAGATASEEDIRDFAATRLAYFKVPRQIIFLDEIPKGPTGKPQRVGLAQRLGLVPQEDRLAS